MMATRPRTPQPEVRLEAPDRNPNALNTTYQRRVRAARIMMISGYTKQEIVAIHGHVVWDEAYELLMAAQGLDSRVKRPYS